MKTSEAQRTILRKIMREAGATDGDYPILLQRICEYLIEQREECFHALCAFCKSGVDYYEPASWDGTAWIHRDKTTWNQCGADELRRALVSSSKT